MAPRAPGQPIHSASEMNRNSSEMPVITSGITSGAVTMPVISVRPRKRPSRARASPASVPSAVAIVALTTAISRLSMAASRMSSLSSSDRYQRKEKPPHIVTSRESLNE